MGSLGAPRATGKLLVSDGIWRKLCSQGYTATLRSVAPDNAGKWGPIAASAPQ